MLCYVMVFICHILCISSSRSLYLLFFSISFSAMFLSDGTVISIIIIIIITIIIIIIIMAVYQHLNARYKSKNTRGVRRGPVTSPASKFTIKSCNKKAKKINLKCPKNLKILQSSVPHLVISLMQRVFEHLSLAVISYY